MDYRDDDDFSCILHAATYGNLDLLKWLVEKGYNVNDVCEGGKNCILLASKWGEIETVKWLSKNGCTLQDRDEDFNTCIILASRGGHLELVKWLIENGCSLDEMNTFGTCLKNTIYHTRDKVDLIIWMLSNGSSLDNNSYLDKNGNVIHCSSLTCERLLEVRGHYETVKRILSTKSTKSNR